MRKVHDVGALLQQASMTLHLTQEKLGQMLGSSKRTAQRWIADQARPMDAQLGELARHVFPRDPGLASQLAEAGAYTLEELGIVPSAPPPAPPAAPALPLAPPAPPPPPRPPAEEIVDAVVCAAAEVMGVMPEEMRAPLLAAFARGRKLGMTMEEGERGLLTQRARKESPVEEEGGGKKRATIRG